MSRAKDRSPEKLAERQHVNEQKRNKEARIADKQARQSKAKPSMPGFYVIRADERRLWYKYFAALQWKLHLKRRTALRKNKRKVAHLSRKRNLVRNH